MGLFDKTHFPKTNVNSAGCFREQQQQQQLKNDMLIGLSWETQSSFSGIVHRIDDMRVAFVPALLS